jgi:quinol monooxygenase YgiN
MRGLEASKLGGEHMIRVVVERRLSSERLDAVVGVLAEEERRARCAVGCLSAETLQSIEDPLLWRSCSTWTHLDPWNSWKASPSFLEITGEMDTLLVNTEQVSVFTCMR